MVCRLTSDMLDNPDENGIYPTSLFYECMDLEIMAIIDRERAVAFKEGFNKKPGTTLDQFAELSYVQGKSAGRKEMAKRIRSIHLLDVGPYNNTAVNCLGDKYGNAIDRELADLEGGE